MTLCYLHYMKKNIDFTMANRFNSDNNINYVSMYLLVQHKLIIINRKWLCFQCFYYNVMFELNNKNRLK